MVYKLKDAIKVLHCDSKCDILLNVGEIFNVVGFQDLPNTGIFIQVGHDKYLISHRDFMNSTTFNRV